MLEGRRGRGRGVGTGARLLPSCGSQCVSTLKCVSTIKCFAPVLAGGAHSGVFLVSCTSVLAGGAVQEGATGTRLLFRTGAVQEGARLVRIAGGARSGVFLYKCTSVQEYTCTNVHDTRLGPILPRAHTA